MSRATGTIEEDYDILGEGDVTDAPPIDETGPDAAAPPEPEGDAPPEGDKPPQTPPPEPEPKPGPEPEPDVPAALDPASIPHEVASQTPAFKGVLNEAQQLREQNRELMGLLQARQPEASAPEPPASPLDDLDDDDPITKADHVRSMAAEHERWEAKRDAKDARTEQDRRGKEIYQSEQQLLADPKMASLPPTLHPTVVLKEGLATLQAMNPELVAALAKMPDPARELYKEVVRRVDYYRNELTAHRATKKTPNPSPKPPTPGARPPAPDPDTDPELALLHELAGTRPAEAVQEAPDDSDWGDDIDVEAD